MVQRLDIRSSGFADDFETFLASKRETSQDVGDVAAEIISDVRARGDAALIELSRKFDAVDLSASGLRFSADEIAAAVAVIEPEARDALVLARDRIRSHHERQRPSDDLYVDPVGAELGHRWTAVESVGLYVPGGTASYPSSVLMNAVPAKVAGVERVVMVVPTPNGEINPLVLAAADLAGVDEIYRVGGAQAIAALAFGTETIAPVVKIVGPGNAFVAAAKRHVFGTVGIDMIAGPSEVLVIADKTANPDWVAADLLAQAEHDRVAQSILITDDPTLAEAVAASVETQLQTLPRSDIASASWNTFGAIIAVADVATDAAVLANRIAAEHLEVATEQPELISDQIRNAGAIFLGHHTPEAIGDYVGGSNHVLPTARSARFSSGLGVLDFMKRTSLLKLTQDALQTLGPAAMTLADVEGLGGHRASVDIRTKG